MGPIRSLCQHSYNNHVFVNTDDSLHMYMQDTATSLLCSTTATILACSVHYVAFVASAAHPALLHMYMQLILACVQHKPRCVAYTLAPCQTKNTPPLDGVFFVEAAHRGPLVVYFALLCKAWCSVWAGGVPRV